MNSELTELLFNSIADLPIAFATWKMQGDQIFISERLKKILKTDKNILTPYEFVRNMQRTFGSFLNTSVEKVSMPDFFGSYSSSINILGQEYNLKLSFNKIKQTYMFLLDNKTEKNHDNSFIDILDSLPIYVWQKDKDLKITYCNKPYADALESTKENVIKNNLKLVPQSKNSVYVDHSLYLTKPKKLTEHVIINGSRRLISIEESPFLGKEKSTGIAIDITEREKIEKNYKDYKKQTEDVLDNLSIPVAIFNENTILVFANQAFIDLFSIEKLDIYENCKFIDIVNYILSNNSILIPEDITKYKDITKNLFQTIIEPYHTTLQLANEKTLNVNITPNQTGGLLFVFEDVSDRISLERRLNSALSIEEETLNHLSEGIIVFGPDNKIKIVNQFTFELLSIPKDHNFKNYHITEFFKLSENMFNSENEFEFWISKLINTITKRFEFSETLTLQSGDFIRYQYIPLPEGFNLMKLLNITDEVKFEKIQKEKAELINQIDKIKSNLISNISYEIKSPLQAALGFAEILYNRYFGDLNEKQLEYCSGITDSIEKLTNIVDSVINLSSLESGILKIKYEETNLFEFISELISSLSKQSKSQNITLENEFNDQNFVVFIDKMIMQQVFHQILTKILQHTSEHSVISISINVPESMPDYFNFIIKSQTIGLNQIEIQKINTILINDPADNNLDTSIDFELIFANKVIRLHNGKISLSQNDREETVLIFCMPIRQFLLS